MKIEADSAQSDDVAASLNRSNIEQPAESSKVGWKTLAWEEKSNWVLLGLVAVAFVVPLVSLYYFLFGVSYFQHFPILLIAGAGLAYWRIKQNGTEYVGQLSIRTLLWLCLSIALTTGVYILPSRWMAAPAAFCWLIAVITYIGGTTLRATLADPMWFALALIPPPSNIANWFMLKLQSLATNIASYWLDYFDIYHYTTGVSIITPNSSYLVKDACSGIQSVFAAIAIGVFYGVMRQYHVARFCLLITQLVLWVLVANSMRVFLIMFMKENYQIDLVEGFLHDAVGAVTFLLGLLLAISIDHLWRFFVPLNTTDDLLAEEDEPTETWAEESEEGEVAATIRRFAVLEYVPDPIVSFSVLGVMILAGSVSAASLYKFEVPQLKVVAIKDLVDQCCLNFSQIDENFFPPELNGWRRMGFVKEERTDDSVFGGMVSFRWQYMHSSGRRVVLSIDGPYDNWHDLTACYGGLGWEIIYAERASTVGLTRPGVAYDLHMRRGGIDHGQSIYLCWDQTGRNIEPPENHGAAMTTVVSRLSTLLDEPKPIVGGAIQLQLYSQKATGISQKEFDDNRDLFWSATELLTQKFPPEKTSEEEK